MNFLRRNHISQDDRRIGRTVEDSQLSSAPLITSRDTSNQLVVRFIYVQITSKEIRIPSRILFPLLGFLARCLFLCTAAVEEEINEIV